MSFTIIPADSLPESYSVSPLGSKGQADAFVGAFIESDADESDVVSYSASNVGSLKRSIASRNLQNTVTLEVLWSPNGNKTYPVTRKLKNGTDKTFKITRQIRQNHGVKLVRVS